MATPYIMPLGFVDRTTDDGTIFLLADPQDSLRLNLDTPRHGLAILVRTTGARQNPGTHKRRTICDGNLQDRRIRDRCPVAGGRGNPAGENPDLPGPGRQL